MAMTSVAGEREQLAAQELHLKTSQFTRYMWAVAILGGIFAVLDIAAVLAGGSQQFYALAVQASALCIIAAIAVQLVRSGRLATGVQFWSLTSSIYLVTVPMLATGLLPFVVIGAVINIVTVAVFLSSRWLKRAMLPLAILIGVATALERWVPWPRIDEMSNTPLIPIALNLTSAVFAAFLINLLGETLLRAVESAQAYSAELEQGHARLLQQTSDLRATTAELVTRTGQLEKVNLELQTLSQRAERRTELLATSALVTHTVSQMRDLEQLLPRVALLIGQAFGYYHVGIYLADELGRFAVLRAASSEGGQRMMESGHKVSISPDTVIGAAISLGQPRTERDSGPAAVRFDNPDLPLTRSRLVVPMSAGQQVFGAMDCHSEQESGFNDEDIANLSALADQIAIAIENASLFAQTQAALQAAQEAQSRYLRQQWEHLLPTLRTVSHEYRVAGVPSAGDLQLPEIEKALRGETVAVSQSPEAQAAYAGALAVPIKLRDQVIGVIDLHETDRARNWTEDDVALVTEVADQAAQALETARLFEQTQQLARREQLVSNIAAKLRASPDVESVLRTTVHEIRRALGTTHGAIRLKTRDEQAAQGKNAATQD